MIQELHREVDIELRPVEVARALKFNVQERTDGHVQEPGKGVERDELLLVLQEEPESMLRDVGHFNA